MLFVDDEEDLRDVFAAVFARDFEIVCAASGPEALERLDDGFGVLVTDMRMHPMHGAELLRLAFERFPDTQRVVLTGYTDHGDLAAAVNEGHPFAYVQKPWDTEQLRMVVFRAAQARALQLENRRLTEELRAANARLAGDVEAVTRSSARPELLVCGPPMERVLEQIVAVAGTDASVLLSGETGVGKELVAAEIHARSGRSRARFVAQNLAALPPELMASELFGHVKGAFTGAQQSRRGLFELADGGTLFLDEIGEAPQSLQALLLRALESREFWPVGSSEPRRVNVRIIAATNRDLLAEAQQAAFRLDLYYRLAVCPIVVPPLRSRPEDVRGLGEPMLEAAAQRMNRPRPRISDAAWRALEAHPWPGNVRELANVMERLVIYHPGRDVDERDLALPEPRPSLLPDAPRASSSSLPSAWEMPPSSSDIAPMSRPSSPRLDVDAVPPGPLQLNLPEGGTTFDDLEREILSQILSRADQNQSRAARSLGMSESTLRSRLKRLGLKG